MKKIKVFMLSTLFVLSACIVMNCDESTEELNLETKATVRLLKGTGTVKYIDLEGGFYAIIGDNGEKYDPINLPEKYCIEGLRVAYVLEEIENGISYHMWGTLVKIISIRVIKDVPVITGS